MYLYMYTYIYIYIYIYAYVYVHDNSPALSEAGAYYTILHDIGSGTSYNIIMYYSRLYYNIMQY